MKQIGFVIEIGFSDGRKRFFRKNGAPYEGSTDLVGATVYKKKSNAEKYGPRILTQGHNGAPYVSSKQLHAVGYTQVGNRLSIIQSFQVKITSEEIHLTTPNFKPNQLPGIPCFDCGTNFQDHDHHTKYGYVCPNCLSPEDKQAADNLFSLFVNN